MTNFVRKVALSAATLAVIGSTYAQAAPMSIAPAAAVNPTQSGASVEKVQFYGRGYYGRGYRRGGYGGALAAGAAIGLLGAGIAGAAAASNGYGYGYGYPAYGYGYYGHPYGYGYYAPFRDRSAYRYTVEDAVYVREDQRGQGVGKAVVAALLERATAQGFRQMIAVIGGADNQPSIKVHAKLGFTHIGIFEGSGFKFGRWIDTVFMQFALNGGKETLPDETVYPGTLR